MRPKSTVAKIRKATMTTLAASMAGRNCIFAIHPSQVCKVPVKSRNSSVMPVKKTAASAILIFLSIVDLFSGV